MSNPSRKRLSIQVVPGHDDEDEEEPDSSPKKKVTENNLNVVNAGSESSPARTPRALKAAQSETKNDISTLISRKSFANVQFHRYSVFASLFDLRAAVPADEVAALLDRHGNKYAREAPDEDEPRWRRCWHCIVVGIRASARQEVRMHPLCFLSLLIGPFMLSFETTCSEEEQPIVLAAKIVHLVSSVTYLFFATAHFLYSPLNPWPEILKQRRKRFKLLSHKAEVLHPALQQQLQARGGGEQETNQTEASKNPLTSLRFWVPIFDGVVFLGFIAEIFNMTKQPARIETWNHWAWLLVTARGFRLVVPPSETVVSNFWIDTLVLGMWLFVVIHLCSCLLSLVSVLEVQNGNAQAWAAEALLDSGGSSCRRFYMLSWYYTATTVTSIGYGDITPQNADERLVASAVMILSQLYFAKVFADLTFLTSMYNQWTLQRHQRMTQTRSALESMNIPKTLIQRVQACQTYVWDMQKEKRAKDCFGDLTTQLQEEVKLVLYSRLVMQVPFLQTLDARALRFLIGRLSDHVFLPADFIICRGDIGNEMYFLREGFAGVFTCQRAHWEDDEIKRVEKGSHFGEIALLTGQLRTAWIMARAYCLTSVLQASAIDNLMAQDPTSICLLIKNFQDMLKLKPSLTWADVKVRLDREFDPDDPRRQDLYDFVCSGDDGLAPAGLITWTRYQVLLSRIQVSQLDQKLLWAELDEEQVGAVTFYTFVVTVYGHAPEESDSDDDPFKASPSRPHGSASLRSSKSARSIYGAGSSGISGEQLVVRKDSTLSVHSSKSKIPSNFRSKSMYRKQKKGGGDLDAALFNRLMVLEDKIDTILSTIPGGQSMMLDSQRLHSGRPSVEVTPPPAEALLS